MRAGDAAGLCWAVLREQLLNFQDAIRNMNERLRALVVRGK